MDDFVNILVVGIPMTFVLVCVTVFIYYYGDCYFCCCNQSNNVDIISTNVSHNDSDEVITFTNPSVIPPGLEPIYTSRYIHNDNL